MVGEDLHGCREFVCGFLVAVEPLKGPAQFEPQYCQVAVTSGVVSLSGLPEPVDASPVAFSGLRVAAKRRERFPTVELELGAFFDVRRVDQGQQPVS